MDTMLKTNTLTLKDFYNQLKLLYNKNLYLHAEAAMLAYIGEPRRSSSKKEINDFFQHLNELWEKIDETLENELISISLKFKIFLPQIKKELKVCIGEMEERMYVGAGRDLKALFYDLEHVLAVLSNIEGVEEKIMVREHSQMDFVHYTEREAKECDRPGWGMGWKKLDPQTDKWEWWKENWDSSD